MGVEDTKSDLKQISQWQIRIQNSEQSRLKQQRGTEEEVLQLATPGNDSLAEMPDNVTDKQNSLPLWGRNLRTFCLLSFVSPVEKQGRHSDTHVVHTLSRLIIISLKVYCFPFVPGTSGRASGKVVQLEQEQGPVASDSFPLIHLFKNVDS